MWIYWRVKVILYNSGKDPVSISKDKAICQFTVEKLINTELTELSLSTFNMAISDRQRGAKGFGSSDAKVK